METILFWARVIIASAFLAYASWSDFKTREISNKVWLFFAPLAFLLTFAQFLFFPSQARFLPILYGEEHLNTMIGYVLSFAITSVFSILLFYAGAFGGADAKALMCIALTFPLPPESINQLSGFVSPIFPITVFSNGVIIAALSVLYAVLRNLLWRQRTGHQLFEGYESESFTRKALAVLCGYKVSVDGLRDSFLYPLEDLVTTEQGGTTRRLLLFPKDENREEIVERLVKAKNEGKIQEKVWATPGLPMLIFITVGFLLALTVGDVIWITISQLL
jgi:preflagellin peptidase FlaK